MTSLNYRFGIAVIVLLFVMLSPVTAQDYRGKVQFVIERSFRALL